VKLVVFVGWRFKFVHGKEICFSNRPEKDIGAKKGDKARSAESTQGTGH
jgi:hypothetical protein